MAHGDAREGKWRENWRMEWVASTLTPPRNVVYPALLTLMRTPRLPAVDWTDAPTDLYGLARFGERRNLVSARVPSRFKRTISHFDKHSEIPLTLFVTFQLWNDCSEHAQKSAACFPVAGVKVSLKVTCAYCHRTAVLLLCTCAGMT